MADLLPCAHCGADGELMLYYDFYRFNCPNENCIEHYTDGMMYQGIGKWYGSIQEAREAWNTRAERTCECVAEYAKSPIDGKTIVLHRCSACHELMRPFMNYCPNCGAKVVGE